MEGYLAMLIGQRVPYQQQYSPTPAHRETWQKHTQLCARIAQGGFTVRQGLDYVRQPGAAFS